jgi:hypothetical protein
MKYKIYFTVPEYEDYSNRNEPEEVTIVMADSPFEAAKLFKTENPEAYIKDIFPLFN